jgi:tetratricopeptide (TPR) repeat protein
MTGTEQLLATADAHQDAGRLAEAEQVYQQVIDSAETPSQSAEGHDGLAAVYQDQGRIDEAVAAGRRAAELRGDPNYAYGLAHTLLQIGRPDDALEVFKLVVSFKPDFAEAHAHIGSIWLAKGKLADAIASYRAAADAQPGMAELHCNLAIALSRFGDEDAALASAQRAVDLKPDLPEAHNILGTVWKNRRRPADALASFVTAAKLKPNFAEAINNIGSILEQLGRFDQAGQHFQRAVELNPASPALHENLAHNLLLRGDYTSAWPHHEWRRKMSSNPSSRNLGRPQWDGSPLAGLKILLHAEQGVGDTIQFCRYIPLVVQRGGKVLVECQASVAPLIRQIDGVEETIVQGEPLPEFDCSAPLLSLPLIFGTTLETIPQTIPYITPDPARLRTWAEKIPATDKKIRVGLTWAGNPRYLNDRIRSCSPSLLEPLAHVPDVTFFSLQKQRSADPPTSLNLIDLTAGLTDFAETAALIAQLDLLICVDTAVAHLAGALGKPTWVMLPQVPDWRWLTERMDSPWYPTIRLFRQGVDGGWSDVIGRVAAALTDESSSRNGAHKKTV